MNCGDADLSPPYVSTYNPNGPYSESLASSASSSAASVWSDASSQSSDDSSVHSSITSDAELQDSYCTVQQSYQPILSICDQNISTALWPKSIESETRSHPRRSSGSGTRSGCPPSLVRQCDRKTSFVDGLVDTSAQIVEVIWPLSSTSRHCDMASKDANGNKGVLPMRMFIQETLRRSRTSYSTLQVALYYLILIKPHIPQKLTQEQLQDADTYRALQCGRRMFLSALILASKYLQDRNYSARAWSKISGLNTQEINQNELAFLLAVNWKLHITEDVFQKWTDIVLKYTPSQPSVGGSSLRTTDTSPSWKELISSLDPSLDNIDQLLPVSTGKAAITNVRGECVKLCADSASLERESNTSTPTQRLYIPQVMEPSPSPNCSSKAAPAFGLLPTPRLTPQNMSYSTPAVSGASYILGKSMCYAMSQAPAVSAERWPVHIPSPSALTRRSSLATSISSMSSPESMVSDNSVSTRSSRSSSISSASSLMSAPVSSAKLDVQARCRYAKQQMRSLNVASVPESTCFTVSPESYSGLVGKDFLDLSLETPTAVQDVSEDYIMSGMNSEKEAAAARALQELHYHPRLESPRRAKRSRPSSTDAATLQDNVRDLLRPSMQFNGSSDWSDSLVKGSRGSASKRVCWSTEYSQDFVGPNGARPGMWEGILN